MLRRNAYAIGPVHNYWMKNAGYVTKLNDKSKVKQSRPPDSNNDWIGPPDPDSNLRPIKLHIPENESPNEKAYRMLREETHAWNQEFWAKHNKEFFMQKEEFIQKKLRELGPTRKDGTMRRLTPEQMSEFYKMFLDRKYEAHKQYNREWYKKNAWLLWYALKVKVERALRTWR